VPFGGEFIEEFFEVAANCARGVLLDEQRGRGVTAEQRQQSRANALLRDPVAHAFRDLGQAAAIAARLQYRHCLFHRTTPAGEKSTYAAHARDSRAPLPHIDRESAANDRYKA